MEEAKAAIQDFTSNHGKHETHVYEHTKPAFTHEHVTPTRHENKTTAIHREAHQEHHHTTVVPIRHREVLPEKHHHNLIPIERREHHHGDPSVIKERLTKEAAQFKDVSETAPIEHSHKILPVVVGEHVHHHVHEYIQPIIQKETVQPTVVHTTIPIHEVHHHEAKHHAASALEPISLADWKKQGGTLTGREVRKHHFMGHPHQETNDHHHGHGGMHFHGVTADNYAPDRSVYDKVSDTQGSHKGNVLHKHDPRVDREVEGRHSHAGRDAAVAGAAGAGALAAAEHHREHNHAGRDAAAVGATGAAAEHHHHKRDTPVTPTRGERMSSPMSPESDRSSRGSGSVASHYTGRTSVSSPDRDARYADTHVGSTMDETVAPNKTVAAAESPAVRKSGTLTKEPRKPSLLKRLNPLKDADGDGRKGIMS